MLTGKLSTVFCESPIALGSIDGVREAIRDADGKDVILKDRHLENFYYLGSVRRIKGDNESYIFRRIRHDLSDGEMKLSYKNLQCLFIEA